VEVHPLDGGLKLFPLPQFTDRVELAGAMLASVKSKVKLFSPQMKNVVTLLKVVDCMGSAAVIKGFAAGSTVMVTWSLFVFPLASVTVKV